MKNKTILVTGGAGFIGSNLANTLSKRNEVFVVDNGYLGDSTHLNNNINYCNETVLGDELPTDVDVVFHLAALSSYGMHEENPQQGARVNVEGFVNVMEQARKDGCNTAVYASTSSIYGSRAEPSPESLDVAARTGYEASKMARERYAEYFSNHYGMNIAGLRYFSVYQGYGGAEGHKGEYANVIAQFADDIANGISPKLYDDGQQTRDFTHVSDVVQGTISVAENNLDGVYNIGTTKNYSFNTIVEMINNKLNTDVDPEYIKNPIPNSVYVSDTCADISKLQSKINWAPTIDIDAGIEMVCNYYK